MARMIPPMGPREFVASSRENLIYDALSTLPDDFLVIHSCTIVSTADGEYRENEGDFVAFNPELGILCIEAKAGQVSCKDGCWHYGDGREMSKSGPYAQARHIVHRILGRFGELGLGKVLASCKVLHAVWFPSLPNHALRSLDYPPDASFDLTLGLDDLSDPEPKIRSIMSIEVSAVTGSLSDADARTVVDKVLCPEFSIVPTKRLRYDLNDIAFARLLDSQARVLNYLAFQRSAAINGAAGTGKTLIAVERAKQVAEQGGRVLFLCFNALLKNELKERLLDRKGISVFTAAGFACSLCASPEADFAKLGDKLLELAESGEFPYDHVVVDEAQDFGAAEIEEAGILPLLHDIVMERPGGTFYMFYDSRQLVQGTSLPSLILDADCKLTLYVNCRNTTNIATCSLRALGGGRPCETRLGAAEGSAPVLYASKDEAELESFVDSQIAQLKERGLDDIVVLTCRTEQSSRLARAFRGSGPARWKDTKVPVHSCRKFKGLEADAVILIDVDESLWEEPALPFQPDPGLLFYTGASRAKYELRIAAQMDDDGCSRVLEALGVEGRRKPVARLAKQLNAVEAR